MYPVRENEAIGLLLSINNVQNENTVSIIKTFLCPHFCRLRVVPHFCLISRVSEASVGLRKNRLVRGNATRGETRRYEEHLLLASTRAVSPRVRRFSRELAFVCSTNQRLEINEKPLKV